MALITPSLRLKMWVRSIIIWSPVWKFCMNWIIVCLLVPMSCKSLLRLSGETGVFGRASERWLVW